MNKSPSSRLASRILHPGDHPLIASFARSRKRSLRPKQRALLQDFLPQVEVTPRSDLPTLLAQYPHAALEIGFGNGEHLLGRAAAAPDTLFFGSEVFDAAMASCLSNLQKTALPNVRVTDTDGRILLNALPNNSLDAVYILFPDPWPKAKHKKRRIVSREICDIFVNKLKPFGTLTIATDHPQYVEWASVQLVNHPGFTWNATCKADWLTPPEGHITTRYQKKAKAGYPRFLVYTKN